MTELEFIVTYTILFLKHVFSSPFLVFPPVVVLTAQVLLSILGRVGSNQFVSVLRCSASLSVAVTCPFPQSHVDVSQVEYVSCFTEEKVEEMRNSFDLALFLNLLNVLQGHTGVYILTSALQIALLACVA